MKYLAPSKSRRQCSLNKRYHCIHFENQIQAMSKFIGASQEILQQFLSKILLRKTLKDSHITAQHDAEYKILLRGRTSCTCVKGTRIAFFLVDAKFGVPCSLISSLLLMSISTVLGSDDKPSTAPAAFTCFTPKDPPTHPGI